MIGGRRAGTLVGCVLHRTLVIVVVVMAIDLLACGAGGGTSHVKEIQRVSAGALDVVLLAAGDGLQSGKDTAVLEFRSREDERLVDVGSVNVAATMPMAGMPPMFGTSTAARTADSGRYDLDLQLGMAGSWRLDVRWDGPQGRGEATLFGSAR